MGIEKYVGKKKGDKSSSYVMFEKSEVAENGYAFRLYHRFPFRHKSVVFKSSASIIFDNDELNFSYQDIVFLLDSFYACFCNNKSLDMRKRLSLDRWLFIKKLNDLGIDRKCLLSVAFSFKRFKKINMTDVFDRIVSVNPTIVVSDKTPTVNTFSVWRNIQEYTNIWVVADKVISEINSQKDLDNMNYGINKLKNISTSFKFLSELPSKDVVAFINMIKAFPKINPNDRGPSSYYMDTGPKGSKRFMIDLDKDFFFTNVSHGKAIPYLLKNFIKVCRDHKDIGFSNVVDDALSGGHDDYDLSFWSPGLVKFVENRIFSMNYLFSLLRAIYGEDMLRKSIDTIANMYNSGRWDRSFIQGNNGQVAVTEFIAILDYIINGGSTDSDYWVICTLIGSTVV